MTAFQKQPSLNHRTTATGELGVAELDAVNGGSAPWFQILSNILKAQSETQKAIAANLR